MLVSVALPPIKLNCTPSQSAATSLMVTLRPTVLPLIDQGISPPPPVSVTFPPIVNFLSRTVSASVAVTFPSTVMMVCPSGSTAHGTPANLPIVFVGWQPMPRSEPAAGCDVVSDGDRRRRALRVEHGTGGDVDLPTTLITASGVMLHTPVTVMLA